MKIARITLYFALAGVPMMGQIPLEEYQQRREAAKGMLQPGELMVIFTNSESKRNDEGTYLYRPDSDFWYLTGFTEPNSALILAGDMISLPTGDDKISGTEFLFVREANQDRALIEGQDLGVAGAKEMLGIENSLNIATFSDAIPKLLKQTKTIYMNLGWSDVMPPVESLVAATLQLSSSRPGFHGNPFGRIKSLLSKLYRGRDQLARRSKGVEYRQAAEIITPMRLIKSEAEIDLIRKSIDATGEGLHAAMKRAQGGLYEYQLQATVEYAFTDKGAARNAFPSIVASGSNALILHYRNNRSRIASNALILMDVGAEYQMYAADITRTVPVDGRFSDIQREIYSYVLGAQEAAMAALKPGITLRELNDVAKEYLDETGYGQHFRHGLAHYLGLDVHDVGRKNLPLEPGMVITIEPGLYLPMEDESIGPEYRGIGVRIEDDFLVTEDGYVHLSRHIPRTITDIEKLMNAPSTQ